MDEVRVQAGARVGLPDAVALHEGAHRRRHDLDDAGDERRLADGLQELQRAVGVPALLLLAAEAQPAAVVLDVGAAAAARQAPPCPREPGREREAVAASLVQQPLDARDEVRQEGGGDEVDVADVAGAVQVLGVAGGAALAGDARAHSPVGERAEGGVAAHAVARHAVRVRHLARRRQVQRLAAAGYRAHRAEVDVLRLDEVEHVRVREAFIS